MPNFVSRLAFFRCRHLAGGAAAAKRLVRAITFKNFMSLVQGSDHEVRHV